MGQKSVSTVKEGNGPEIKVLNAMIINWKWRHIDITPDGSDNQVVLQS